MERKKTLEIVLKKVQEKLKNAPGEHLIVRTMRGIDRYYQKTTGKETTEKYLGADDMEIIKILQERDYYTKLRKAAERELRILNRTEKLQKSIQRFEQVYSSLTENRRTLITPLVSPEDEELARKIEREYMIMEKEKRTDKGICNDTNFITMNGEKVRSKSELIIADRLKAHKIPYHYESELMLADDKSNSFTRWLPDFKVLNIKTGKPFFWEHLGLMDNQEYCKAGQIKLETYAKSGIVIGKNLIITMESSLHPLNVSYVDKLICEFLEHD